MTKRKPKVDATELKSLLHRATSLALDANDVIESECEGIVEDEECDDFKRLIAQIRREGGLKSDPRTEKAGGK